MSLNKAMVIGRLGQDPEIRYAPTGLPVVNFSVATDEPYLDKEGNRQERTEWHRVVVIGKLGLTCHEYLKKGRQVFVEGQLRNREYETKVDGRKQHRTEIIATRVQFLGAAPPERSQEALTEDSAHRRLTQTFRSDLSAQRCAADRYSSPFPSRCFRKATVKDRRRNCRKTLSAGDCGR
jgi:single-strand DNA-binding protein